jgi:HlyD family secretion protein
VLAKPGDIVNKGDLVVELDHTEYDQKIDAGERKLDELRRQFEINSRLAVESDALLGNANDEKRRLLDLQVRSATAKVAALVSSAAAQRQLFDGGIVTRSTLDAANIDLQSARLEVEAITSQLRQIDVDLGERRKQRATELATLNNQIQELRELIGSLKLEQVNASQVISSTSGRIIEMRASVGQYLERGAAVVNLEHGHGGSDMRAYIYLPLADGRKILAGMAVEVNPTTSKREEFGFLRASVSTVADQPSTSQGLMLLYSNDRLVQQLTTAYAPLQVIVRLRRAERPNPTGFEWSTRNGPPDALRNGTACSASVVLREVHPIELMFPELRRYLGDEQSPAVALDVR